MSINVKTSDGELKPLVGTYKGAAGVSPEISENLNNSDKIYKLDITDVNGTKTTPNLIGATGPQGEKGATGAQGIQGPRGTQGEKGDIGPTGEAGFSPILTENTDNSDTVYKLDITDANGTFSTPNLVGKQGPQGIQGEQGPQGEQGIQGPVGVSPTLVENPNNTDDSYKLDITDANGTFTTPNLIGRQGIQGIQGEQGPQGEQGVQGIQGIQGPRGNDGYPFLIYKEYTSLDEFDPSHFPEIGLMFMVRDGSTENVPVYRYTGETDNPYSHTTDMSTAEGLKGDKGDKGDQGEQGIQGEKGADGVTYTPVIGTITTANSDSDAAADVSIDTDAKTATFNFTIPRGVQGIQGIQGEQGPQGEKGIDGSTYTPAIGTVSTVNAASEASANIVLDNDNKIAQFNFSIPRGAQGLQGLQGPKGEQGEIGADGVDGTTYIPAIGTITTVESSVGASATVELNEETKQAVFNFDIPKGVGVKKVEFTSSTLGDVAGIASATDTYTITYTDGSTSTYEVYNGKDCDVQIDDVNEVSDSTVWSSQKTSDKLKDKLLTTQIAPNSLGFDVGSIVTLEEFLRAIYNKYGTSGTLGFWWSGSNEIYVEHNGTKVKINGGIFTWQSTNINNGWQHMTAIYAPNSSANTMYKMFLNTGEEAGTITSQGIEVIPTLSDTSSTTSTYSSAKIDEKYGAYTFGTAGATQWLKLTLGNSSKFQPIIISDQYGGKVEITGMADDSTYKPVKLVRYSYGDWTTYSATDYTTTDAGDANYKIRRLFYYPAGSCYYLEIRQYCTIKVSGAISKPEMVTSLPAATSEMTLIPESSWGRLANWKCQNTNYNEDPNNLSIGTWVSINASEYPTNMPNRNGWATVITFASNNNANYKQQLCLYTNYSLFYARTCVNGVWGDWKLIGAIDNSSTSDETSTWSSSKIASEINPTIDSSKVFSNGALNIATLCSTYGNGRYVIVGQGTAGNGSATIDIWTLASNAISYIVNVTYSNKTSNTFIGLTYENPTINFETNYLSACNHIAKVCTLA